MWIFLGWRAGRPAASGLLKKDGVKKVLYAISFLRYRERGERAPETIRQNPSPCMWSDRPEPQDTEKKGSTAVR